MDELNEFENLFNEKNYIHSDMIFLITVDKYLINANVKDKKMLKTRIHNSKIFMMYFNYFIGLNFYFGLIAFYFPT